MISASSIEGRSNAWERAMGWIRRKHRKITWKDLRRRLVAG
jgi:hypothetical protein